MFNHDLCLVELVGLLKLLIKNTDFRDKKGLGS